MVRLLSFVASLSALIISLPTAAQTESANRHRYTIGADISYVDTSSLKSWTEGFVGKLRFDEEIDGLVLSRAFVDYEGRVTDTLDAKIALEIYADDIGSPIDFTEAYLEWRPVPRSANRYRLKFGAFYPRISLENTDAGWTSSSQATWNRFYPSDGMKVARLLLLDQHREGEPRSGGHCTEALRQW